MKQDQQWQKFLTAIHTINQDEPFSANHLAQKIGITPFTVKGMIDIYQIIRASEVRIIEKRINKRVTVFLIKHLRKG